jgi:hypothetical protein
MTDEKEVEGNGSGLIKAMARYFLAGNAESEMHLKLQ